MQQALDLAPLLFWAAVVIGALYTIIASNLLPLAIVIRGLRAAIAICLASWPIFLCLIILYALAPFAEATSVVTLQLRGVPLLLAAGTWQVFTAAVIAAAATFIHERTLPLPARNQSVGRSYLKQSVAVGIGVYLALNVLQLALSYLASALQWTEMKFEPLVPVLMALAYVPLALLRPALSLGYAAPFRAALDGLRRAPLVLIVWITAAALPLVAAQFVTAQMFLARPSVGMAIGMKIAAVVLKAFVAILFETTLLLLFARVCGWRLAQRRDEEGVAIPLRVTGRPFKDITKAAVPHRPAEPRGAAGS